MDEKIIELLKGAKGIQPSHEFRERSKRVLFALPLVRGARPSFFGVVRQSLANNMRFAFVVSLTTVFVIVAFGSRSWWGVAEDQTSKELMAEAKNIEFKIQLESANYFVDSANEVTAMLQEIKKGPEGQSTDELLNKIIF